MRQGGFTLLEMMLVLLLIGSAASLVMMSFPTEPQAQAHRQLARFQAQLAFAMEESRQHGLVLGILVRPEGWRFRVLRQQPQGGAAVLPASDRWQGYLWQEWRPGRAHLGIPEGQEVRLELLREDQKTWPSNAGTAPDPDILLLPGGEITTFRLHFHVQNAVTPAWLQVDGNGQITSSQDAGAL
ncbi:type II secretion system minor pseudopilin GspH [Zobellella sp. DQSA1]|uniref:type II secretion system minor pseudopilin GspH n=1 Tax=Zobellella sp. DQSA1 TaxID=3342386 RepID=UPI0035BF59A2